MSLSVLFVMMVLMPPRWTLPRIIAYIVHAHVVDGHVTFWCEGCWMMMTPPPPANAIVIKLAKTVPSTENIRVVECGVTHGDGRWGCLVISHAG